MAEQSTSFRAPKGLKTVEYADREGNVRTLRPSDGVLTARDADDAGMLRSFGYTEIADDEPKAATKRRGSKRKAAEPKPEPPTSAPTEQLRETASEPPDQESK